MCERNLGTPEAILFDRHPASFRDPNGFVFHSDQGELLRQVNRSYESDYRRLMESGLFAELTSDGLLIDHEEVSRASSPSSEAFCVIRPQLVPFVSYPYEWAFSALQDAALLTLDVQQRALRFGMSLKDASAYNVQFIGARPTLIDTLSFEQYEPGLPWSAYGQFCRHFLAPLALMARTDIGMNRLSALWIDGVPLQTAASMLPGRTRFSPGMFLHLHLHARMIRRHGHTGQGERETGKSKSYRMSSTALANLLDSLRRTVTSLRWKPRGTEWADYYEDNSYTDAAANQKQQVIAEFLAQHAPATVWDLGANTGVYSRLASRAGAYTCAFDIDPACVERNYLDCRSSRETNLLPLWLDLTNPSPALGWAHRERQSLAERGPADVVMALALIHHLAISNNVPLPRVAEFFRRLGRNLIIEFVPKEDPQVQRLLRSRKDIFPNYTQDGFASAFGQYYHLAQSQPIGQDGRVLYRMVGME